MIEDGRTGRLFRMGDVSGLAAAMRELRRGPRRARAALERGPGGVVGLPPGRDRPAPGRGLRGGPGGPGRLAARRGRSGRRRGEPVRAVGADPFKPRPVAADGPTWTLAPQARRPGARARAVTVLAIFLTTAGAGSALAAHRRASGRRRPSPRPNARSARSPPPPRSGSVKPRRLTGTLSCTGTTPAAQQTVTIEQHVAGTPGLALAGTATTGPGGEFSFTTALRARTGQQLPGRSARGPQPARARGRIGGRGDAHGSGRGGLAAAPRHPPCTPRRDGGELTFQGTVTPATPGARVVLQRQSRRNPQVWRPIAHGLVQADGSYTLLHAFSVGGTATVRVVVRGRGLRATGSEALRT